MPDQGALDAAEPFFEEACAFEKAIHATPATCLEMFALKAAVVMQEFKRGNDAGAQAAALAEEARPILLALAERLQKGGRP